MTIRYLTIAELSKLWFNTESSYNWTRRYVNIPEPDGILGGVKGWLPERESDWRRWYVEHGPGREI